MDNESLKESARRRLCSVLLTRLEDEKDDHQVKEKCPDFGNRRDVALTIRNADEPQQAMGLELQNPLIDNEPRWYHPSPTERLENPAYTYLKNHPEYQRLFFQHEIYSRLMTEDGQLTSEGEKQVNPAVKSFIDLCNTQPYELITDSKYEPVFVELISQSSQLTDVELLLIYFNLRRFPKRPSANDKEYKKIWRPLDDLCMLRIQQHAWNLEYMFNLADLVNACGLGITSRFVWELKKRLTLGIEIDSKDEFFKMMFCFGGVKSLSDTLSIYNIEYNLQKFIDELTSEEVSVISVGFLRTKTLFNNKDMLRKMLQIVEKDAQRIPSQSVSAVAKAVAISKTKTHEDDIYRLLFALDMEVKRLDFHACAAIMSLGFETRRKNVFLLAGVANKLLGKVGTVRSKDLERICNGLASFDLGCDALYQEIIEELRKKTISMSIETFAASHGRSFISILVSLSMRNIYPQDLISLALSDDFLGNAFGQSKYTYTPEVLYLDICVGLEARNYSGPRLSVECREVLTKKNMLWLAGQDKKIPSLQDEKIAKFMVRVCENSLGGPEFCHNCNILPPFPTIGLVYCIREPDMKPVPVPFSFTGMEDFVLKYLPASDDAVDDNVKFHAFVLFPKELSTVEPSQTMGMARMILRLMEKLGFQIHPYYVRDTNSTAEIQALIVRTLPTIVPERRRQNILIQLD